ncbi:MAG: RNA pseudouridine synthase [Muribaculaceae bacterium]|nr:RNA pseudouridine synthase [Muribaculaceae bacterium]
MAKTQIEYEEAKDRLDAQISEYNAKCRQSKLEREAKRESGMVNETEIAAMIRQSQFEKAELHRLKKKLAAELEPFAIRLKEAEARLAAMKEKRRSDSEALQKWLFDNFRLLNACGEIRSLSEIFSGTAMKIPPSGAGECCAPKLLQVAYLQGLQPKSIAEYWYGQPKGGEVRIHGVHYPACRGKCLPILRWMLKGLSIVPPLDNDQESWQLLEPVIVFENQWFCVVNKPCGMLSVPGRGAAISLQQWLQEKYGEEQFVKLVHRLDQDTSGLVVAALSPLSFKVLQGLFARRKVKKTYVADLEGDYESLGVPNHGRIELRLSPDWLDRPRQRIDIEGGKDAVTDYKFENVSEGRSRVIFHPLTGRTHQLRVHSASSECLGMPIVGDRLYGINTCSSLERLHLHAREIDFTFPIDNQHYRFESPVPF